MKWRIRVLMAVVVLLVAGVAGAGLVADDQESRIAVRKLADAIEKNDPAAIKEGADAIAKMPPVFGSIATIAPTLFANNFSASCWSSTSR